MSPITLKLKISASKITIKIMGEQASIWNKICRIHINKKALELQINNIFKTVQKNHAQKIWTVLSQNR